MRTLALILPLLALLGCGRPVPELGRDLPANYAEGERLFNARLQARFPSGSDAGTVAETLRQQGFTVQQTAAGGRATFSDGQIPVASVWTIGWDAADGRLTRIWGVYGGRGP